MLDRATGQITHTIFREIVHYLNPGDLLVLNNFASSPRGCLGAKDAGGADRSPAPSPRGWRDLGHARGRKGHDDRKTSAPGKWPAGEVIEVLDGAERHIRLKHPSRITSPHGAHSPAPPYIRAPLTDHEPLSDGVRTPTRIGGGAHCRVTLHPGVVRPVGGEGGGRRHFVPPCGTSGWIPLPRSRWMIQTQHVIHAEWCQVSEETAATVSHE